MEIVISLSMQLPLLNKYGDIIVVENGEMGSNKYGKLL